MKILQMSAQGSLIICFTILLRSIGKDQMPKQSILLLWRLALARLIIPIRLSARWSLYGIFAVDKAKNYAASIPAGINVLFSPLNDAPVRIGNADLAAEHQSVMLSLSPVSVLWVSGLLITAFIILVRYGEGSRVLQASLPISETSRMTDWRVRHPLRRRIRIFRSDHLHSPMTTGLLHPKIFLPANIDLNADETYNFILTHEYFHIRRFDRFWKYAVFLAVCAHWFNPLVWLLALLFDQDLERSCDSAVLRSQPEDCRASYARLILMLAEENMHLIPLYSRFAGNAFEERIRSIMKQRKVKRLSVVLAAIAVAFAVALMVFPKKSNSEKTIFDRISQSFAARVERND